MTTYYIKRGRRYIPVSEYDADLWDSLPYGAHLVVVEQGMRSIKHKVEPSTAPVLSALRLHRDAVIDAVRQASEMRRGVSGALTSAEIRGLAAYRREAGADAMLWLTLPSAADIVDALERSILECT